MGVDYSTTVAYGYVVGDDEITDELKEILDDEYYVDSWEIAKWLKTNGYVHLRCDTVGNMMDGDTKTVISVDRLHRHFDVYDSPASIYTFKHPGLMPSEVRELAEVKVAFGLKTHGTQWVVAFNVS